MTILFTLFFISLAGILVMVGKKLAVIEDIHLMQMEREFIHPFVPDIQRFKIVLIENVKKYGHASVVLVLRMHIRSSNVIKNKYETLKDRLNRIGRNKNRDGMQPVEVSKFLKMVSEYKHKIREIKHRITEEENNL